MEKQFNLIIDTKRTGFNAVRGFKQEENNSVLYINLVQNSIPFDLTGLTVRINFKRPDGQVLLQMADVTNATEGKIKVNILTRVLKLVGEVKADLSIFNKENEKITSASFSMFVDAPIYTNDYITKNDEFDIIQRVWTSEDERIRAENKRKENETNRQSTENTRIANEDSRKVEETKRSNNEKTREDNEIERKKNETNRIENEKNRAVDEVIRGKNEENRVTKESERTQAESIRETNETTRQQGYTEIKNTVNSFSVCEEYNSEKEYKEYNRVTFNGSSYECLKDCTGIEPTNIEHWICIAEKGKDGLGSGNMHTDTYDKNQNGIVDKAESITDGNITYTAQDISRELIDIISKTNNLNVNDYYARQDIMEMKLKLKEKLAIDFINQTGIGFYDTLENSNLIEWLTGDVSVSPSNKNASFGADGTIHYLQKGFPEFHKMRLQLNNVLINYIVALTGSNHTDTFAYNQARRQVYPGEKLYIPLDKEEVTIKSVEPSYEPKDIQAQIYSISGRSKSTLPTNNVSMGGIDKNGNLFTGYVREEQVIIYKSTDQGSSWKEYYRFNVGYFRNPMILVYKTNIYVAFSLNGLARLLRIDTETPTLINDYNLGSTGYNFFDMAVSPDGRTLHWVGTKDSREQVVYSSYNLDSQGILNGGQGADRSIWAEPVSPAVITMVRDIPVISVFKIDKASETGILSYAWASERNVWRYKNVTELSEKVKVDRYDYYNISSDFIPNQDPNKPGTLAFMWNVASKDIAGNHLRLHYTHQLGGEGVNVKQPMQVEPEPYDKFNEYFLQHTHDRTLVMACMRRSGSTDYFEEYTFSETQNKFLKVKQIASEAQTQFQQLAKLNIPRLARPTYTYVYNRGEEGSGEKRIFVRGSILVLGETGGVITMEKPVNVGGGHSLPIVSYDVKLGTQKVRLSDIIGTTYMYDIDNVKSTTVELYIQGKNIVLNSVAYAIV